MQIHEVTKQPLKEGLLDAFQSPDKMAAQAAEKLRAQGYGQEKAPLQPDQAIDSVQKNSAQQQYIKGLVAQWQKDAPKAPEPDASTTGTASGTDMPGADASAAEPKGPTGPTTPGAAPAKSSAQQKSSLPSITVGGKLLTKGPDGLWHGEDGRAVQDPAQAAKIDKAYKDQEYRKKQFQQTAMVKEATFDPQQAAAAKAQRRRPAAGPVAADPYKSEFEKWAAKKLLTKEPVTRNTITLDAIKSTAIGGQLEQALAQVVATAGDPQKNAVAVNNYLTMAVAGVVMKTQELRNKQNTDTTGGGASSARVGQGIMTRQELLNQFREIGFNDTQTDKLIKLGQNPAARQAMLKLFGV